MPFIENKQLGSPPYEEQYRNYLAWKQAQVSSGYWTIQQIVDDTGKSLAEVISMVNTWVFYSYAEWKNGPQTHFAMTSFARQAGFLASLKLANS